MTKMLTNNTLLVLLLAVLVVVSVLLLNHAFQSTMDGVEWQETVHVVERGDSLWAISGKYCPESVDRREWIEEVQVLNDMPDSNIRPGQRLTVLALTKEG